MSSDKGWERLVSLLDWAAKRNIRLAPERCGKDEFSCHLSSLKSSFSISSMRERKPSRLVLKRRVFPDFATAHNALARPVHFITVAARCFPPQHFPKVFFKLHV